MGISSGEYSREWSRVATVITEGIGVDGNEVAVPWEKMALCNVRNVSF